MDAERYKRKGCWDWVINWMLGMSDDMEAAIASGSTMVRIGSAIFGARDYGIRN